MNDMRLTEAAGHAVGDTLRISCEAFDSRVVGATPMRILVAWPWFEVDEESENRWDGTRAFPRKASVMGSEDAGSGAARSRRPVHR